ncbi:hypothetical protein BC332_31180 [Capsicum chinense]|nr:hypothetical protein BC332_31180 [Capsicum chinense]
MMSQAAIIPTPMASHEKIVNDPTLFMECLKNFHSVLSTKNTIPVIGGKELDLHVLYVEVTKRGGFDKVVAEKKWREVSSVFSFSPTTTSASYALRKHYFTLLHHFEQVYFFRHNFPGSRCFQAEGTIDAKFDCGYFVSMKMGSEVLSGVLYHPHQQAPSSSSKLAAQNCNAVVPYNAPRHHHTGRRNRRRKNGDPNHPKANRSGYNFFFAEKHAMLKSLYPHKEREFTKMIGESWNNLSPEEKMQGLDIAVEKKKSEEIEERDWNIINRLACGTIRSCLSREQKYAVKNETSAHKLWKALEDKFLKKSGQNKLLMKKRLFRFDYQHGTTMNEHITMFNQLVANLLNLDVKFEDEDML